MEERGASFFQRESVMRELLKNLFDLQALEFGDAESENAEIVMAELRGRIPLPILGHYDRLTARGKRGIALVKHSVCTGCHMRIPIGVVNTLMRGEDIQMCGNCGRYLCLGESETQEPTPEVQPEQKPRKRGRKPQPV